MKTLMIGSRKGGVPKTTTAVNLSYELTQLGHTVLLIDFDSQADATKFTKQTETEYHLGHVLKDRKFDINNAIYPAQVNGNVCAGLYVLPGKGGDAITRLEMDMQALAKREERLKLHLQNLNPKPDFVIIDTPPASGILSLNAVYAADFFIFPTTYTANAFDGVETMITHIEETTFKDESELNFLVLPVKVAKAKKKESQFGEEYLQARWPNNTAKTIIFDRAIFTEAELDYEPLSAYQKGHAAAMYYKNFAKEVLSHV